MVTQDSQQSKKQSAQKEKDPETERDLPGSEKSKTNKGWINIDLEFVES